MGRSNSQSGPDIRTDKHGSQVGQAGSELKFNKVALTALERAGTGGELLEWTSSARDPDVQN